MAPWTFVAWYGWYYDHSVWNSGYKGSGADSLTRHMSQVAAWSTCVVPRRTSLNFRYLPPFTRWNFIVSSWLSSPHAPGRGCSEKIEKSASLLPVPRDDMCAAGVTG